MTIKYNTHGQMMWKKSLNWSGNNTDEVFGMNIDRERNIYVVGYGRTVSVYRQMVTIKYSSNGDSIWTKIYRTSPTTHDWGYSVTADDSLNVYSSGYGVLPVNNEIVTIKYDEYGNEKWIQRYPTYSGDYLRPTFSKVDQENNLIVVGYSYSSNAYDFVTLKYSPKGNFIWSRLFSEANDDYAKSVFLDRENNILIGGSTYSTKTYGDYLVVKYSPEGDTLLIKILEGGSSNSDQIQSIVSDDFGNIYATGFSQSGGGVEHYLTVKLNSSGDTLWTKTYRTAYSNLAYCINLDLDGSVYVSGSQGLPGGNSGILSIKYSQLTGMLSEGIAVSDSFKLSNYPNPFNPFTQINFQIPVSGYIKLKIFDVNGKEVETIVNEFKTRGDYSYKLSNIIYSSGVYFYSLILNDRLIKTNKMILMR